MRRRFLTRSGDKQAGAFRVSWALWALPLPHFYWGREVEHVWFGFAVGGTGADDVFSVGVAFDLPGKSGEGR
jgi:hypothetical protein